MFLASPAVMAALIGLKPALWANAPASIISSVGLDNFSSSVSLRACNSRSASRGVMMVASSSGFSGAELARVVEKAGNSIAAITKEVELEKTHDALTNTDSATP